MTRRTPPPPPPGSAPYAGPLTRATVALDPRDPRRPVRDPLLPPHEPIDPWAEWQRHVDAGRIGEGAGKGE